MLGISLGLCLTIIVLFLNVKSICSSVILRVCPNIILVVKLDINPALALSPAHFPRLCFCNLILEINNCFSVTCVSLLFMNKNLERLTFSLPTLSDFCSSVSAGRTIIGSFLSHLVYQTSAIDY